MMKQVSVANSHEILSTFFYGPIKKLVSQNKLSHMIIRIHICVFVFWY